VRPAGRAALPGRCSNSVRLDLCSEPPVACDEPAMHLSHVPGQHSTLAPHQDASAGLLCLESTQKQKQGDARCPHDAVVAFYSRRAPAPSRRRGGSPPTLLHLCPLNWLAAGPGHKQASAFERIPKSNGSRNHRLSRDLVAAVMCAHTVHVGRRQASPPAIVTCSASHADT